MTRCESMRGRFGPICDAPATAMVTTGCVHEHLRTATCCSTCRDELASGVSLCAPCDGIASPAHPAAPADLEHDCVLRVLAEKPLEMTR